MYTCITRKYSSIYMYRTSRLTYIEKQNHKKGINRHTKGQWLIYRPKHRNGNQSYCLELLCGMFYFRNVNTIQESSVAMCLIWSSSIGGHNNHWEVCNFRQTSIIYIYICILIQILSLASIYQSQYSLFPNPRWCARCPPAWFWWCFGLSICCSWWWIQCK